MTWLVWRQHRQQALFALAGLAVLAAFLVPTGLQMRTAFANAGLDDCLPAAARVEFVQVGENPDQASDQARRCQDVAERFASRFGNWGAVGILLWFLPLLAGLFWGAPLVAREVEHSTHRLVWTQGSAGATGRWSSSAWSAGVWRWSRPATRCWSPGGGPRWTRPPASGSPGPCSTWRARRWSATPCSPWPWGCSRVS
jgi:hypothetical protein